MLQYKAFNRTDVNTDKTILWYNQSLHQLNEFLKQNGHSNILRDLDLDLIRAYTLHLQKRHRSVDHPHVPTKYERLSPATVETHVRAIRAFFRWLHRKGYTEEHILGGTGHLHDYVDAGGGHQVHGANNAADQERPFGGGLHVGYGQGAEGEGAAIRRFVSDGAPEVHVPLQARANSTGDR